MDTRTTAPGMDRRGRLLSLVAAGVLGGAATIPKARRTRSADRNRASSSAPTGSCSIIAMRVKDQIVATGRATPARLGVAVQELNQALADVQRRPDAIVQGTR